MTSKIDKMMEWLDQIQDDLTGIRMRARQIGVMSQALKKDLKSIKKGLEIVEVEE